jgi:hypothetical protein
MSTLNFEKQVVQPVQATASLLSSSLASPRADGGAVAAGAGSGGSGADWPARGVVGGGGTAAPGAVFTVAQVRAPGRGQCLVA